MAESLVSLMAKLSWLAGREWIQPMANLSEAIGDIMAELKSTHAFLNWADGYENSSLGQMNLVNHVRGLANKVEDIIDDYVLHCSQSLKDIKGLYSFSTYIIRQVKSVGTRHKLAKDVAEILPKFEEARKRFSGYNNVYADQTGSTSSEHNPQDDAQLPKKELVGIEGPKAELIEKLVHGVQKLQIILVVGMCGMGKTTLVKNTFEDGTVQNHFDRHIWINFTSNSKPEELFKEVIEIYCLKSRQQVPERLETMNCLAMKQVIWKLLGKESYLIVLDNVQALDKWNAWLPVFPNNENGSRVIITTHDADVAQGSRDHIHHMKPLSDNDSKYLFSMKAFGGNPCPDHLSKVQDSILEKCGGMPLAIEAIGSLLRDKPQTKGEWNMINNSLGTEMQGRGLKSVNKLLLRCYHDVTYNLKPCFLYMTIFPEDHFIGHLKLIRLWVAEGLVTRVEGITADEVAEGHLFELVSRSLIEVAERRSDGRVKSYRVHGLMRIILTTKAKEQNFVARNKTIDSYDEVRRLSVQNSLIKLRGELRNLRSLLLFKVEKNLNKHTMPVLFNGMSKLLTVLDLQGAKVDKFPSVITDFLNLRYLSLKNTMIKEIPSSIERLRRLETLDLKRTGVQKLPLKIKHLQELQNLLIYQYGDDKNGAFPSKHGFQAPKGIGGLKFLQKLCFIEADDDNGSIVEELGELTELRRLGIVKLNTKHEVVLWSSIQKMSKLRALSITVFNGETMNLQSLKSPPECLERLYLSGALKSFSQWTESPSLGNLVKIFLKSSNLDEEPLNKLGNLKNLTHIELQQVYNGKQFRFGSNKFHKLKILGLRNLEYLETVEIEENSMPNLEKFLIQECRRMNMLPLGIDQLTNLKMLDFVGMPEEVFRSMTIIQSGKEFMSIQHIPHVSFTTYEDQDWIIRRVCTLVKDPKAPEFSKKALLKRIKIVNNK